MSRTWDPTADRTYLRHENLTCYIVVVDKPVGYEIDLLNGRRADGVVTGQPLGLIVMQGTMRIHHDDGSFRDISRGDVWSVATARPDQSRLSFPVMPYSAISFSSDKMHRSWDIDSYLLKGPLVLPDLDRLRCCVIGEGSGSINGVPYDGPRLFYFPKGRAITIAPFSETAAIVFSLSA